jgi:large-conductance mechanosensitive channel
MDQPAKPFTSDGGDTRRWFGRIIIAVLLGEALWGLIVSVMNHVIVPWLGDVMGQSSGLPTSFTQRPYNYPELFVSVFEFCIAGLVAAILNFFFQRQTVRRVKTSKSSVAAAPGPIRVVPQAPISAPLPPSPPPAPFIPVAPPVVSAAPVAKAEPIAPVVSVPIAAPAAVVPPAVPTPAAAKPQPPAPKAEPVKPKKPKNVYYNIVGEPMPSDDD